MKLDQLILQSRLRTACGMGALLFALNGMAQAQSVPPIPDPPRDYRAAWCATVSRIDWPPVSGTSNANVAAQKAALIEHLDAMESANMNAMYLQVRPECNAVYQSTIEPPSQWVTGSQFTALTYDPLTFAITEAHKRGIELHAWVNPYRASVGSSLSNKASYHVTKARPDLCVAYGGQVFMDPGKADSITWIKNVISDMVTRYDLDGVVFDDYFYPGPTFDDDATYQAYLNGGGTMELGDWRRNNVDKLIQQCSTLIHGIKPYCQFAVGPFGIWRPNNPAGVIGSDYYASHYCDTKKWLQQGWVDSLSPQLYWPIASTGQPFGDLIDWWAAQNPNRNVMASTADYRVGNSAYDSDFHSWGNTTNMEIVNEVNRVHQAGGVGTVHYSMKWLTYNNRDSNNVGLLDALRNGPYAEDALPPRRPWLDNVPPPAPNVSIGASYGIPAKRNIYFSQQLADEDAMWWCVYVYDGNEWNHTVLPGRFSSYAAPEPVVEYAVSAVDRSGNESVRSGFASVSDWELY